MARSDALRRSTTSLRRYPRRKGPGLITVAFTVVLFGGGFFVHTAMQIEILKLGYRIEELEEQLRSRLESERQLRLEIALRRHPSVIEERARQELDMAAPSPDQVLLQDDLVVAAARGPQSGPAAEAPDRGKESP